MKVNTDNTTIQQDSRLSSPAFAVFLPMGITFVLFGLGAFMGGEVADRGLLPTVRFLSLVMLASGLSAAFITGSLLSSSSKYWVSGQISAVYTGLGAGLLWSGDTYFAGFGALMIGALVGVLLLASVLRKRALQRQIRVQAQRTKATSD